MARRFGVEAEVAKFEDWDPAGREFDAAIAGQAWHWVDPVAGAAKAAQVLRPAAGWPCSGTRSGLRADVNEAFAEAANGCSARRSARGRPPGRLLAMCTKAADGMRQAGAFGDPEEWRFDWDRPYTRDEWLEVLPTFGGYSQYPPASAGAAGGYRRRHRLGGRQLHDGLHRDRGHRGAIRRHLTRPGPGPADLDRRRAGRCTMS